MESSNTDLKTRIVKSALWYTTTRAWVQLVSWGVTIVLARILSPQDYGLFALSLAFLSFLELFQELGLGVAIIRHQALTRQQLNAIFWIIFSTSLLIVAFVFFSANLISWFYGDSRLVWILRTLSLIFLITSLGSVPYSLLTKKIDFWHRSLAEAYGVVTSAVTALSLALLDYGVWALIFGHLARAVVRNGAMAIFCRWKPTFDVSFADMSSIMKFGFNVAGASALSTFVNFVNLSIISRFLGAYNLGLWSMANSLGRDNPVHRLSTAVINQLSLPVFSQLQQDKEKLRNYFLKITKYLAIIALPLQIGTALVASDAVHVLLSEKWLPMVPVLQIFAVGGVFYVLPLPSAPLLQARGRADTVFRFSILSTCILPAAIWIGTRFSLLMVATAWIVTYPILRIILLWLSIKEINISLWEWSRNIVTPILAVLTMNMVIFSIRLAGVSPEEPVVRLAIEILAGGGTYGVVLLSLDRLLVGEIHGIMHRIFAPSVP